MRFEEDKPRIVVSKCLGIAHCRYDGSVILAPIVDSLRDFVEFVPVCPELEIGLGAPPAGPPQSTCSSTPSATSPTDSRPAKRPTSSTS